MSSVLIFGTSSFSEVLAETIAQDSPEINLKGFILNDEYYTNELRSVIFYSQSKNKVKDLSSYQKALSDLLVDADIVPLQLVYDCFDLGKLFQNNIKTLHNYDNELYKELYNEIPLASTYRTLILGFTQLTKTIGGITSSTKFDFLY